MQETRSEGHLEDVSRRVLSQDEVIEDLGSHNLILAAVLDECDVYSSTILRVGVDNLVRPSQ